MHNSCSTQQISKNIDSLVYNYIREMIIPDFGYILWIKLFMKIPAQMHQTIEI